MNPLSPCPRGPQTKTTTAALFLTLLATAGWTAERLPEAVRSQITELVTEKSSRNAAQRKMDSQLVYLRKQEKDGVAIPNLPNFRPDVKKEEDDRVLVDVRGLVTEGLLTHIRTAGGTVVESVPRFDTVRVRLPVAQLEALAVRDDVRFVEPAVEAMTNIGPILSQGDRTHRANTARATFGVDGTGIKIGVLSDGVNSLASSKSNGELNARARALGGQAGSGDEGTAMMEIVQDLLPGADVLFATAFNGDAGFANNILSLQAAGCSVIVDDVTYFNESPFQDMVIAQAVNTVSAAGVLYFSSAGNSGNLNDGTSGTWEGDFLDGGAAGAPISTAGTLHDFGGGTTYNAVVSGGSSRRVDLFWADPNGASTNDYDLFVLDGTGTSVLRSSTNIQNGTQNPYEAVSTLNVGERIVIVKKSGSENRFLQLTTGRARLTFATSGVVRGHNASGAANAFSVAATWVGNSPSPGFFTGGAANPVETFSSDGPRRMFFQPNGTPYTVGNFTSTGGLLLQKPDITAADGGSTSVGGFTTFFGTSAAAPHAAAIAGMLKSYNPSLSAAEIRNLMTSTALDIEAAGQDRDSGVGIVMAQPAMQATAAPDVMTVTSIGLFSSGMQGGSFSPSSGSYVVTNTGSATMNWSVSKLQSWTTVSPENGSLAPGASATVTCTFNAAASALSMGNYSDTLSFTNTGTGFQRQHTVNLIVQSNMTFIAGSGVGNVPDGVASTPPAPGSPLNITFPVSGLTSNVSTVTLSVTMNHAWAGDVHMMLTSPGGTRSMVIFSRIGATTATSYGSGAPLSGTYVFSDAATGQNIWTAAASGSIPTGTYRTTAAGGAGQTNPAPVTSLNTLFGGLTPAQANGTWTLTVTDVASAIVGSVSAAGISFSTPTTPSANTNLASLVPITGSLSPSFTSATSAYGLTVPANVTSISFTAVPQHPGSFLDIGTAGTALLPLSAGAPSVPIPLQSGVNPIQIQVTAPSGALRTYTVVVTRQGAWDLVVPQSGVGNSNLNTAVRSLPRVYQFAYSSAYFAGIPLGSKLTGFSFRLANGQSAWPAAVRNWSSYDIQVSSTLFSPSALSTTFANNIASDVVTVRSGAFSIDANAYAGGTGPTPFGPIINFSTPYYYNGGNLLVTIRHTGNGVDEAVLDSQSVVTGLTGAMSSTASSTATTGSITVPPIVKFSFSPPAAGIFVTGNSQIIANGDITPGSADHTAFGSALRGGGLVSRTFTILNFGSLPLTLTGNPLVQLTGAHAADFSVTVQPDSTIATGGASATFQLTFDPTDVGQRTAIVSISNDDSEKNPYTFTIQGNGIAPDINVSGNSTSITNGDMSPDLSDHTEFGPAAVTGAIQLRTYTLSNSGTATLNLTGSPRVEVSGPHAADFSITTMPATSLGVGGTSQLGITFNPSWTGLRTAIVSILSSDDDESPFVFGIQGTGIAPEINLVGNFIDLASGDTTPSTVDHTDFGNVLFTGGVLARTFTIQNIGDATLNLTGTPRVQVVGTHLSEFTVTLQPSATVNSSGDSTTFQITFDPAGLGVRTATVSIANDDLDENPYTFAIQGNAIAPEVRLSGNGLEIASGSTTPALEDHTDFGEALLVGGSVIRTFTIGNIGTAPLNLNGSPRVQLSGIHAAEFSVATLPAASVAPSGGSTTFQLAFDPTALGARNAIVSIANNDLDENPYTFAIQGTSVAPEMDVAGNSVTIQNGDTTPSENDHTDFGGVVVNGGLLTRTFTIANNGTSPLHLGGTPVVEISGSASFIVQTPPDTPLAPANSATFVIAFDPDGAGQHMATITIANDDPDEAPFSFQIQGTGLVPVMTLEGNGLAITDDDTTPQEADHTHFGEVAVLNTQMTRTFTVGNIGHAPLNLSGTPLVVLGGAHPRDFRVTLVPSSPVEIGEETTFAITFDPALPGPRTATVSIGSDDPVRSPYTFSIEGFGALDVPLPQSISFSVPSSVYLSQSPLMLEAHATSGLPVIYTVLSGPAAVSGQHLSLTGPGRVQLQASQPGGRNYMPAPPVTVSLDVRADPSELTLFNLRQQYNGFPKPVAALGTSDPVTITYKVGGAYVPIAPTNAGSYPVKAIAGAVIRTGTLVISKAPLTIAPDHKRKFAGMTNPLLTFTYSGFQGSDTAASAVSKAPKLSTTAVTASPGGLYPITSTGGSSTNYAFIRQRGTLVVESFAGGYEALLADSVTVPVAKISLTVTATNKGFTGRLHTAAEKNPLPLAGILTTNPLLENATGTCTIKKSGITYSVHFTLPLYGDVITTATRDGNALGYAGDGRRLLKLSNAAKKPYGGAHTLIMEPAAPAGTGVPAGSGWAKAGANNKGVLTLTGRLADGTPFTTVLPPDVDSDPAYRLFLQPYLPARTESFLAGQFRLVPHPILSARRHVPSASLTWIKTGLPADASYRSGFGPVTTDMTLDPWLPPAPGNTLAMRLGLADSSFTVFHGPTGSGSHGSLPTLVTLSAANSVSVSAPPTLPPNITRWKTFITSATGNFTGSFELNDAGQKRAVPFTGILRQPPNSMDAVIGDGHYLLPALPGSPSNEKTSGEILFRRPSIP